MKSILSACIGIIVFANSASAEKIRVTADNVNVRADSNLSSRVMGQVSMDTVLESVATTTNWISILPPKDVVFWIHSDLLAGDKVKTSSANLRSGPGINYVKMISIPRNTHLNVKGTFANWTKVAPPPGATVWISREFTEALSQQQEDPKDAPSPSSVANATEHRTFIGIAAKPPQPIKRGESPLLDGGSQDARPAADAPTPSLTASGITTNMLVKTKKQGVMSSHKGILKRASVVWRRPSRYLLLPANSSSNDQAVCYVTGNDTQLESILGRKMTVEGKQYIVQGARFPVLMASRITLH